MNQQIKNAIYFIGLGMTLVAYAHYNFASKDDVVEMKTDIRDIRNHLLGEKK